MAALPVGWGGRLDLATKSWSSAVFEQGLCYYSVSSPRPVPVHLGKSQKKTIERKRRERRKKGGGGASAPGAL